MRSAQNGLYCETSAEAVFMQVTSPGRNDSAVLLPRFLMSVISSKKDLGVFPDLVNLFHRFVCFHVIFFQDRYNFSPVLAEADRFQRWNISLSQREKHRVDSFPHPHRFWGSEGYFYNTTRHCTRFPCRRHKAVFRSSSKSASRGPHFREAYGPRSQQ